MFAHWNFSFSTLSVWKWPKSHWGVADLPAWDIILHAASAIFHLFEPFSDFWIAFMFAHWNFSGVTFFDWKWPNSDLWVWQICLLGAKTDSARGIFSCF